MRFVYLTTAALAIAGAAAPAMAQDPAFVTLGAGYFDLVRADNQAADFRAEYRSDLELWIVKPWAGVEATSDGAVYVASLRGEKLWRVPLTGRNRYRAQAVPLGDLGRLRTVATTPDGRSLWVTTSNRDGRGDPRRDDDRIIVVR